jgi:AcrR family transcriptional regulator
VTDKKEKILYAALELFANESFNATSTRKIALKAGVSEGLIFRHFKSKKGLLDAIMEDADKKLNALLADLIFETIPRQVIRKRIELPFLVEKADYAYWKLQFKLKWDGEYYNPEKMKPVLDKLSWAFAELNFKEPENEARLLEQIMDSISGGILREGKESQYPLKVFLLEKYDLQQ